MIIIYVIKIYYLDKKGGGTKGGGKGGVSTTNCELDKDKDMHIQDRWLSDVRLVCSKVH